MREITAHCSDSQAARTTWAMQNDRHVIGTLSAAKGKQSRSSIKEAVRTLWTTQMVKPSLRAIFAKQSRSAIKEGGIMLVDEIKTIVRLFVDEPWNKGNVNILDDLCAPDYTVIELITNWKGGREDLKDVIQKYRAASPNFHAEVGEIIVEGDRVAYLWNMTGTNQQGKPETSIGITLLRLENGKIVEDRFVSGNIPQVA